MESKADSSIIPADVSLGGSTVPSVTVTRGVTRGSQCFLCPMGAVTSIPAFLEDQFVCRSHDTDN